MQSPRTSHQADSSRPKTIPALQEWNSSNGTYEFTSDSRVVRNVNDAVALAATSRTCAADLSAVTGRSVSEVAGTEDSLRPGDIFLSLGSDDMELGAEGYELSVDGTMRVTAREDRGVFYGTRTILQLIRQSLMVPCGSARDWPLKPERGLMVDVGRKYFTVDWLRRHIKEIAYLKMNMLHLHLCDNQGFRIESSSHPEVVDAPYLTKSEVSGLIALAEEYKITIVPEIEMPGHMAAILEHHEDLQLRVNSGDPDPRPGDINYGLIDLSKEGSYTLMDELLDEYLDLFPGPYWHLGADEYAAARGNEYPQLLEYARSLFGPNAVAKDAYLGFINRANARVRAAGKTTRAWNDGIGGGSAVTVDSDVALEYWTNDTRYTAQELVDLGHPVSNESWDPTYYVLQQHSVVRPDVRWGYEEWQPDLFAKNDVLDPASAEKNLGSKIHIWCDFDTRNEEQIAADIENPLRMLSQQVWGSPHLSPTWEGFTSIIEIVGHTPNR
ncbi:family 20 glycosylhydrolase [Streptomyces sp. CA2R101]|uniref:family 20 glycosylhydrolase n=1 Tax=Streptomyces sp. CA2R101 TaxID=3120152 RepID=UPI00300AF8C5